MSNIRKIDIENWVRKEHFENFKQYEDPFFNICADVEITALKDYTRKNNISFFVASYYGVVKTVNAIEEYKYRIRGEEVIVHENIRGGCTVMRDNRTFGFAYFDYADNFADFQQMALAEIERVKAGETPLDAQFHRDDLIHGSVIPWVSFRSFEHAKRLNGQDSVPKVVLGKYYDWNGILKMPVSVALHHALGDGLHVGEFFEYYQNFCNEPERFLD